MAPLSADTPFCSLSDLVRAHAAQRPSALALADAHERWTYADLDRFADRLAAGLQQRSVQPGQAVGLCADNSARAAAVFLGILRAGAVVVPLPASLEPTVWGAMWRDSGAVLLFADGQGASRAQGSGHAIECWRLDEPATLEAGLPPLSTQPTPWVASPEAPFNIIYSSGTTGTPKGIVSAESRALHAKIGRELVALFQRHQLGLATSAAA